MRVVDLADPAATPGSIPEFWAALCALVALVTVSTALVILGFGVVVAWEQRRSRGQLPPGPGPDGHARDGERRCGAGLCGSPRPPHRPDLRRPAGTQVASAPTARSRPSGPGTPWRETGARHGMTSPYQPPDPDLTRWDVSTDLFAVGVVLYQLLCDGHHPYPNFKPMAAEPVIDPRTIRSDLNPDLAEFLIKACGPANVDRFSTEATRSLPCVRSALTFDPPIRTHSDGGVRRAFDQHIAAGSIEEDVQASQRGVAAGRIRRRDSSRNLLGNGRDFVPSEVRTSRRGRKWVASISRASGKGLVPSQTRELGPTRLAEWPTASATATRSEAGTWARDDEITDHCPRAAGPLGSGQWPRRGMCSTAHVMPHNA